MGLLSWIVLGLLAGALAKFLMPGNDPGGFLVTTGIGVIGALIGGAIATSLGLGGVSGLNLGSIVIAVAGSLLLLIIYRRLRG